MKLLKDKNLPMIPYKAQRLLQKRRTVETSERYPKVRRQPKINQGVEYETMLPMGYRGYDAVPAESRAPPQIEVNAAIIESNIDFLKLTFFSISSVSIFLKPFEASYNISAK